MQGACGDLLPGVPRLPSHAASLSLGRGAKRKGQGDCQVDLCKDAPACVSVDGPLLSLLVQLVGQVHRLQI